MSDNKNITFKTKIDSSGLEQQLESIKRKVSNFTRNDQYMSKASQLFGDNTPQGRAASKIFQREREADIRALTKEYETMDKAVQKIENRIKGLTEEMSKQTGEIKAQTQARIDALSKESAHAQRAKIEAQTGLQGMGQPPQQPPQGPQGMAAFGNMLKAFAGSAILGGGLNFAATVGGDVISRRRQIAQAEGSVYRGASRDMQEMFQGRGSDRFFYSRERAEAADILKDEFEDKRKVDVLRGGAGGVAGGLLGAAGGAAVGGKIGTGLGLAVGGVASMLTGGVALPTIGALGALGGTAGTAIGGLLGGTAGASMGMGRDSRMAIFDPERYNKEKLAEAFQQREAIERSLIFRDPRRLMARESFMNNAERYAEFQGRTGLSDEGMYGDTGFLRTQMRAGEDLGVGTLRERDVFQAQQQIQNASGLTQESLNLSGRAAALRRRGFSNAGEVMGRVAGAGLDAAETDEAVKKLMTEAVRAGVDASKMPQELKNFTTVAAGLATQGGGFSETMAGMVGAGLTGFSQQQIQAAASEAQEFEQRAGAAGGYEGQLGFGFLQSDRATEAFGETGASALRKDPKLMNMLNQLSASDLEKDPELAKGLADKLGIDENQLREGVRKKDIFKQSRTQEGEDLLNQFAAETKGMTSSEVQEFIKTDRGRELYTDISLQRGAAFGSDFIKQGRFRRMSEIGVASAREGAEGDLQFQELTGAAQKEMSSRAQGDLARVGAISDFADKFRAAAEKNTESAEILSFQFVKLKEVIEKEGGDIATALGTLKNQLDSVTDMLDEKGIVGTK